MTAQNVNGFFQGNKKFGFENVGIPYLSGAILQASNYGTNRAQVAFTFPQVSRTITVVNSLSGGAAVNVHFAPITAGNVVTGSHYLTLPSYNSSFTFNVAANAVYVSLSGSGTNGGVQVVAELTATSGSLVLTGSGVTD